MSVNKVILVGNVGKDPETRYLDEGTAISKFPLATSETYRNRDGERVSNTEWHNVVLWRGLAQVAEKYVKKGTQVYIEGRIKSRSYDDANGIKRYVTEIVGDQMQLLGKRPDDPGDQGEAVTQSGQQQAAQAYKTGPVTNAPAGNQGAPAGNQGAPAGIPDSSAGNQDKPNDSMGQNQATGPENTDPFDPDDGGPDDLPF